MNCKKILLGLTTTRRSDWRGKTREIDELGIKEIALFPTCLEIKERKELYKLLENTKLESIPHVHLRGKDVEEWELELFVRKYKTQVFNIHPNEGSFQVLKYEKFRKMIYVENQTEINEMYVKILNHCNGICLDVSHWEDQGIIQKNKGYDTFFELLKKYKIGCCHISGVRETFTEEIDYITGEKCRDYSDHLLRELKELDYVKKYIQYLPEYVSIELENSFKEQLEIKKYLEKIIK